MAVIGKQGSYANVQPIDKNYIGDAMQGVTDRADALQAKLEAEKKARAAAKLKQDTLDREDQDKIKQKEYTEHGNLTAAGTAIMDKNRNEFLQLTKDRDSGKISPQDFNAKRSVMFSDIDALDAINKNIQNKANEIDSGVRNNKLNPYYAGLVLEKARAVTDGNVFTYKGPNGRTKIKTFKVNDDGSQEVVADMYLDEFYQKGFDHVIPSYDLDKDIKSFADVNELTEQGYYSPDGTMKITEKKITPEIKQNIDLQIKKTLLDKDKLAVLYNELTDKDGRNLTDPEEIDKVRKMLKDRYNAAFPSKRDETRDLDLENLNLRKAAQKKADEKEIIKPVIISVTDVDWRNQEPITKSVTKDTKTGEVKKMIYGDINPKNLMPKAIQIPGEGVKIIGGGRQIEKKSDPRLKIISLGKDGQLYGQFSIQSSKGFRESSNKTSKDKKNKTSSSVNQGPARESFSYKLLDPNIAEVASKLGYSSIEALKEALRKENEGISDEAAFNPEEYLKQYNLNKKK